MGNDPVNRTDPDGGFDWFQNSKGEIINRPGDHAATALIDGIEYTNIGASLDVFATRTVLGKSFQQKIGSLISTDNGPVGGEWHPVDNIDFLMSSPSISQGIAKSDGLGTTHIGYARDVDARIRQVQSVYNEAVGEAIRGGIVGAVSYMAGGDKWAIAGSYVDQAMAAHVAFKSNPAIEPVFSQSGYSGAGSGGKALNTRFVTSPDGVTVDLEPTLNRISSGGSFPHRNDGSVFQNRPPKSQSNSLLPIKPLGYYKEFVVPTPGKKGPGAMRIVTGKSGEAWFTPDHYNTFIPIK